MAKLPKFLHTPSGSPGSGQARATDIRGMSDTGQVTRARTIEKAGQDIIGTAETWDKKLEDDANQKTDEITSGAKDFVSQQEADILTQGISSAEDQPGIINQMSADFKKHLDDKTKGSSQRVKNKVNDYYLKANATHRDYVRRVTSAKLKDQYIAGEVKLAGSEDPKAAFARIDAMNGFYINHAKATSLKKDYYINRSKLFPEQIIADMEEKKKALRAGRRQDGTLKGNGFLGELKLKGGGIATEYTIGTTDVTGKEMDIPSLVPTLTKAQVKIMTDDIIPNHKPVPKDISTKAVAHAKEQIRQGKSVFADTPDEDGLEAKDYEDVISSAITAQNQAKKAADVEDREDKLAIYKKEDEGETLTRDDFNAAYKDPDEADSRYDEYVSGQRAELAGEVNYIAKGDPVTIARVEAAIDLNPMSVTEDWLYANATQGLGTENITGFVDRLRKAHVGQAPMSKYNTQFSTLLNAEYFGKKDDIETSTIYLEMKRKMTEYNDSQKPTEALADAYFNRLITKNFKGLSRGGWSEKGIKHTYINDKGEETEQRFMFGDIKTITVGGKKEELYYAGPDENGKALWIPRR